MQLRPYQQEAVNAVYNHISRRIDNPCVVIPTGGGKTPVIATICRDAVTLWGGRVLVLAHVKELLEQSADKLRAVCPEIEVGIYSAGLGSRDTQQPVIVAGIQSVYERACDLGRFDLVIVDEAHLIPPDGEGMYRRLLADLKTINPNIRIIGLTATPFRLSSGDICTADGILNHVCFEIGVKELIVAGYLSPLTSKGSAKVRIDTSRLHIRAGEFIASEIEELYNDAGLVNDACREIVERTADRKAVLLFCAGIDHAFLTGITLEADYGQQVKVITGDTPAAERAAIIAAFRAGELKYLLNVNVLTTGFDAPNVDCVVLLRPTASPGLYYQMVGRGFRLADGKADCLVLDFGGNVKRHGPVDNLNQKFLRGDGTGEAPAKECPECCELIAAGYANCPACGFAFPPRERAKHDASATDANVLSEIKVNRFDVMDTVYRPWLGKGKTTPTMRVDYQVAVNEHKSEWVCFEHELGSFPHNKAVQWWHSRSPDPLPKSVAAAVEACNNGAVAACKAITVQEESDKLPKFLGYELGPKPEPFEDTPVVNLGEVPF